MAPAFCRGAQSLRRPLLRGPIDERGAPAHAARRIGRAPCARTVPRARGSESLRALPTQCRAATLSRRGVTRMGGDLNMRQIRAGAGTSTRRGFVRGRGVLRYSPASQHGRARPAAPDLLARRARRPTARRACREVSWLGWAAFGRRPALALDAGLEARWARGARLGSVPTRTARRTQLRRSGPALRFPGARGREEGGGRGEAATAVTALGTPGTGCGRSVGVPGGRGRG